MSTQFTNRQWRLPNNENKDKQSNYSMDFDGSSQYVQTSGLTIGNTFTFSCWLNVDSFALNNQCFLSSPNYFTSGYNGNFIIRLNNNSSIIFASFNGSGSEENISANVPTISTGSWHHFALTNNGSTAQYYWNGSPLTTTGVNTKTLDNLTAGLIIGDNITNNNPAFNGKIDAVSIFNYALSSSQVTTLYGSSSTGIGNPMSLSPKPVAYYPLGDQDAFNGANYLVPNIAAEEDDGDIAVSYSPYALEFDGTNDYISCGNDSSLNITSNLSVSAWFKTSNTGSNKVIVNRDGGFTNRVWQLGVNSSNQVYVQFRGATTGQAESTTTYTDGSWHHVVAVYEPSVSVKLYIDGNLVNTDTTNIPSNLNNLASTPLYIAAYSNYTSEKFNGYLSNVSYWNTDLTSAQVTEIYNEGVPSNLNNHSAYSNLVSWWQLGSNSSFNTNWTVLDEKGSNNGTSYNMTEDDIVDGVGSYANGLSSGMGGDEVIGDAPYSSSNALSVNMDVEDRVTDTPS